MILDNAVMRNDVFGRNVMVGAHCTVEGSIFGDASVRIGEGSVVAGNIISRGSVTLGRECETGRGDRASAIIGVEVRVGAGCKANSHVVAEGDIFLEDEALVAGSVISTGGNIELGRDVHCGDALCAGELTIGEGAEIEDNVIWARRRLAAPQGILIGGRKPEAVHQRSEDGFEINLNNDDIGKGPRRGAEFVSPKTLRVLFADSLKAAEQRPATTA
jgi:predicted acyltransferase (DUF342 family)